MLTVGLQEHSRASRFKALRLRASSLEGSPCHVTRRFGLQRVEEGMPEK